MGTYKKINEGDGLQSHILLVKDFQSHIKRLKDLSYQLGNTKNEQEIRSKIIKEREDTMQLSKSIMTDLRGFSPSRNEKLQYDKLMSEFEALLNQYNQVCQGIIKKENVGPKEDGSSRQVSNEIQDEIPQGLKQLGQLSDVVQLDRRYQIEAIEKDMSEVHAMFKEVAEMVGDQGQMLDSADQNVDVAVKETGKAVKELEKSNKYQISAKKKLYCIIVIVVILLLFLAAVALGYIYF